MNIVLIGYRGSGKSSVGKALAAAQGMEFVDTDVLIERCAGLSIKEIFEQRGEPAFRALEKQVIAEVAARDRMVIATGGGAVLDPDNVRVLRAAGSVVWLRCPADELERRISSDPTTGARRPNLTAAGGLEEIRRLLDVRTPLYRAAAHQVVDVRDRTVEEMVETIRSALPLD